MVTAREGALRSGNIGFNRFPLLPHSLVEVGQADLDAQVVRLSLEELFQQSDGFSLAIVLQVNFGKLQEERARFAQNALLDIQVREALQRLNLFRGELC